jgi:hypothetical protein
MKEHSRGSNNNNSLDGYKEAYSTSAVVFFLNEASKMSSVQIIN